MARLLVLALIATLVVASVAAADCIGFQAGGSLELADINSNCLGDRISAVDGKFGWEANAVGDINGDGMVDFAIGAIGDSYEDASGDPVYKDGSEVAIIFGTASNSNNVDVSDLDGTNGFLITNEIINSRCGYSLAGVGDFNGDGIDDLGFGCDRIGYTPGYPISNPGASYILYGSNTFAAVVKVSEMTSSTGIEFIGGTDADNLGVAVAGGSDLNGDTYLDIVMGALTSTNPNEGSNQDGAVYVIWGTGSTWGTFSNTLDDATLAGGMGLRITSDMGWCLMGHALKLADINGDGTDDIVAAAPRAAWGHNEGYVWVIYGGATEWPASPWVITGYEDASQFFQIQGPDNYVKVPEEEERRSIEAMTKIGWFGTGMDVGDINGDGIADVVASAPKLNANADDAGSFYVIWGTTIPKDYATHRVDMDVIDPLVQVRFDGAAGDVVFSDLDILKQTPNDIAVADFNGDGFADIAYGAYNANGVGSVSVVYGASGWDQPANDIADWVAAGKATTLNGVTDGALCGWAVGSIMSHVAGQYDLTVGCPGANVAFRVAFDPAEAAPAPASECPEKARNVKNLEAFHDTDGATLKFKRRGDSTCEQIKARVVGADKWVKLEGCGKKSEYMWSKNKMKKKLVLSSTEYKEADIEWKVQTKIKATEECPTKLKAKGKKIISLYMN